MEQLAANHLEQLVAESYEYCGYFVRRNVHVGLRPKGGYECKLDVVAFRPTDKTLMHIEPSLDADSWEHREKRYSKKFAAGLGSIATTPNIPTWYATLTKRSWNPPNWLFGPVWTTLYICMAVAAWLVWRQGGAHGPLTLCAVQLVLNAAWSWIFFWFHMPGAAFVEILILLVAIAATTIAFWPRSLPAGILMVPYSAGWLLPAS